MGKECVSHDNLMVSPERMFSYCKYSNLILSLNFRYISSFKNKLHFQHTDIAITKSQQLQIPTQGLHKNGPINRQAWMEGRQWGPYPSLINYMLQINSRRRNNWLQLCSNSWFHRLWWIIPIQWSHNNMVNLNESQNKTKVLIVGEWQGWEQVKTG